MKKIIITALLVALISTIGTPIAAAAQSSAITNTQNTPALKAAGAIISPTAVRLSRAAVSLKPGKTATLRATVLPKNTRSKIVTWSSDNPAIATVTNKGRVRAINEGTATITATTANGLSASCVVTVYRVYPTSVRLNRSIVTIKPGKTSTLRATVMPRNNDFKAVTWSSDNPAIATVTNKGRVRAVSPGTATITATTANGIVARCTVNVPGTPITPPAPAPAPAPVSLAAPIISINPMGSTRDPITVTISIPDGATRVDYTIDSGNGWRKYEGPFTVTRNCTISAQASTHTALSAITTIHITNYDSSPVPPIIPVAIDAGSSYKNAVADVLNAAKEAAGLGSFNVSFGGIVQSDAERIVVDPNASVSGICCMISGNYSSGSSAGRKVLSLVPDIVNYDRIRIGAAYLSTDGSRYVIVVAYGS